MNLYWLGASAKIDLNILRGVCGRKRSHSELTCLTVRTNHVG